MAILLGTSMLTSQAGGLIIVERWWPGPGRPPEVWPPIRPPRPIPPPDFRPPNWRPFPLAALEVASEKIDAKIKDQVATISIEQEFYNPNSQQLEGTFLFPIPKGAQLDKFKMEIGGKMMEPELLAADKARKIYEDIVRAAKDPALMEYEGRDLLKVRIFPIEGHSRKKIALSYTQILKQDNGLLEMVLPLSPQKYSAKPVEKISLNLEVETTAALKTVYSPTHSVDVDRNGARRASVKLDERQLSGDKDFHLIYSSEKSEVALNVLTHRAPDGDGYFLLFASPGVDANEKSVVAKDVAFVLDTSCSMSGGKIEQARKALLFCVRNLNEGDRFEVLRFSTDTEALFHELRPASKENVQNAESFIEKMKALNGTAIDDALKEALELRKESSDRPFVVIFLTDGLPTVGETKEEKILANVKDRAKNSRVFCFGIGSDVNTHLLDKIAEETRAFSTYVTANEDIEVKVSSFFSKIRDPLLANLKIETSGGDVRLTKQYPSALPDLFKGEQLILAGRYTGNGKATIKLEGTVNGEKRSFTEKIEFPEKSSDHEFIPRLWATRRVGSLLDQIRLNGENAELKDEVTSLARQYGIVTPYTAYLIMEDETRRGVPIRAQSLPNATAAPEIMAESRARYYMMNRDRSGTVAVDASQANQSLKQAQTISPAPMMAPGLGGASMGVRTKALTKSEAAFQQNARFVAGRNFVQNGNQWVDSQSQNVKKQSTQRLRFGSEGYFAFATKYPKLAPILSLGSNIQFVHEGELIEIYE